MGWTRGWITTVLALRELGVNLWDLSKNSTVAEYWPKIRGQMLRYAILEKPNVAKEYIIK